MYEDIKEKMVQYTGKKAIKATPMNRGEYDKLRNWFGMINTDQTEEGYLVEYIDGGEPNHKKFDNYIFWFPKIVFDKTYKASETFLDRMKVERNELFIRKEALRAMIEGKGEGIPEQAFQLMKEQYSPMCAYLDVLETRIIFAEKN